MNINRKCPECGMYKKSHPTTGEYCLHCGWVECLHTPGPWMVTRDPGSEIGARLLEPAIKEQLYFEDFDPEDSNAAFMETLFELHNANNDRLMEAVPELYNFYLKVKEIMKIDNDYYNLIPDPVKTKLGQALDRVEQTRIRHLDRNVKKLMKEE